MPVNKKLNLSVLGNSAFKIALYYLIFGFLWILLSDRALLLFTGSENQALHFQTYKGWLFVLGTTILIFFLVYREMKHKDQLIKILNESEKWYNLLVSNIPEVDVFLFDKNHRFILAQGQTMQLLGLSPEEIQNRSIQELASEKKIIHQLKENFTDILGGEVVTIEFTHHNLWYELRGLPVYDNNQSIIAGLAILVDISRHKKDMFEISRRRDEMEVLYTENLEMGAKLEESFLQLSAVNEKITESELKYRLFFENINDGAAIFELDKDLQFGKFLEVNEKLAKQLGYSISELVDLKPSAIFDNTPQSFNLLSTRLIDSKSIRYETNCINKSGNFLPFELSIFLLHIENKNLCFLIARNISERVKYISELKLAKQHAENADRLKTRFLANMSHEVRTPLNGILGFAEILAQKDLTVQKREQFTGIIRDSSNQILQLINDIMDVSKIETSQISFTKETISINEILNELKHYLITQTELKGKSLSIQLIIPKDAEHTLYTDKYWFQRVFIILLQNAFKFTSQGNILFGYEFIENNMCQFYVEDTGRGIEEDKINLIFDRFRQADESDTREFGGIGLGLAIVKGIVELLKGSISVVSKNGVGTRFTFTLPVE